MEAEDLLLMKRMSNQYTVGMEQITSPYYSIRRFLLLSENSALLPNNFISSLRNIELKVSEKLVNYTGWVNGIST
jgi:hypothetical protein